MITQRISMRRLRVGAAAWIFSVAAAGAAQAAYVQTNLVTDNQAFLVSQGFAPANVVDPRLINPWGVSRSAAGPFWVSDQGTGLSTLYNTAGTAQALVVTVPGNATPPTGPTGQVFNSTTSFTLPNSQRGLFFFANLDGSISGWNGAAGTTAQVVVPASSANRPAVYTGITIANAGGQDFLYAANRASGAIDVFSSSYVKTTLAGNFVDPGPNPNGLVPFNVSAIGGRIYVAYSIPGASPDEAAAGLGFVSVFNADGTFVQRIVDEGGPTTSPWGLAIAPSSFAEFSGALLVANFSESLGFINAYNPITGALLGALTDTSGAAINIPYLWEIIFGNGGNGGVANTLYFSAGIGDEQHGLFAQLVPTPIPPAALFFGSALAAAAAFARRRGRLASA